MELLKSISSAYIRHGLTLAAGYLLAHGLIGQPDQQVLISAGLGLAGVAWSTLNKVIQQHELQIARRSLPQPSGAVK